MPTRSTPATRQTWLIILGALAASCLVYAFLAYIIEHNGTRQPPSSNLATMRPLVTLLALGELGASVAYLHFSTLGKMGASGEGLMTPSEFQTRSIVAMAFAESCTISGLLLFFLGNTLREFAPYIAGTLAVFLLVILPKGLRYFAAWERSQEPKEPSPFSS